MDSRAGGELAGDLFGYGFVCPEGRGWDSEEEVIFLERWLLWVLTKAKRVRGLTYLDIFCCNYTDASSRERPRLNAMKLDALVPCPVEKVFVNSHSCSKTCQL